jgi:hypothetical protein
LSAYAAVIGGPEMTRLKRPLDLVDKPGEVGLD